MGGTGKKNMPPGKVEDRSGQSSPVPAKHDESQPDDFEDGDIATPKRDLDGDDDQPL